jgi:uncharacterized repeat protein (TIGR02059 family)
MAKIPEYPAIATPSVTDTDLFLIDDNIGGTRKITVAQMKAIFGGTPAPDTVPPVLQSIAVSNSEPNKIVLTYNESLLTTSVPATSAYNVAGKTVSSVSILGPAVTLIISVPYAEGDTITVSYTPGGTPIKDLAGNTASGFSLYSGTNNIGTVVGGGSSTYTGNAD